MGNEHGCDTDFEQNQNCSEAITAFLKGKLKNVLTNKHNSHFIMEQEQSNCDDFELSDLSDGRRLVFVSVIGLYQSWRNVPYAALSTSLLLLPLKRQWVYDPTKYLDELQSHFTFPMYSLSDPEIISFIQFLKRKDAQGEVVWMMDDYYNDICSDSTDVIHPFWHILSEKLTTLTDSVTGRKYNSLNLDVEFWKNGKGFVSKYGADSSSILSELSSLTMRFNAIQEILYQSNPTLNPIKAYKPRVSFVEIESTEDESSENEKESWFFSESYDSYDGNISDITDGGTTSEDEIIQLSIDQFDLFFMK